ncbi:hypothetical protein CapIbe_018281 [Capra ibex]
MKGTDANDPEAEVSVGCLLFIRETSAGRALTPAAGGPGMSSTPPWPDTTAGSEERPAYLPEKIRIQRTAVERAGLSRPPVALRCLALFCGAKVVQQNYRRCKS